MSQLGDLPDRNAAIMFTVAGTDLAPALGSGDVPVLATPRMIAWMEAATVAAVAGVLPEGATSVGTRVDIEHLAASAVGAHVTVSARVRQVDGKSVVFDCEASCADASGTETLVGRGRITRAVVRRDAFVARLRGA